MKKIGSEPYSKRAVFVGKAVVFSTARASYGTGSVANVLRI
jgi:hypothetical protein